MMGLDVGDKRIGVALSDPTEILASMLTVIERKGDETDFRRIADLAREHGVGRIVIGLPRLLSGGLGTQAEKTQVFIEELSRVTDVPIDICDERLSTTMAEQLLRDAGRKSRQIRAKRDAAAAALILQWYLNRQVEGQVDQTGSEAQ